MTVDLLVFGPHADDIEIGLGGDDCAARRVGHARRPVRSHREPNCRATALPRAAEEAAAAARVLGALWRENLGWPDGGIDADAGTDPWRVDLIRRARPRTIAHSVLARSASRPCATPAASSSEAVFKSGLRRYETDVAALAAGLGLLLLHQRQHARPRSSSTCRLTMNQAGGAGLLSEPVCRGRRRGVGDALECADVPPADREPRRAIRRARRRRVRRRHRRARAGSTRGSLQMTAAQGMTAGRPRRARNGRSRGYRPRSGRVIACQAPGK